MRAWILNARRRFLVATKTTVKQLVVGTPQGPSGDLLKEARFAFNYSTRQSECEVSLTEE